MGTMVSDLYTNTSTGRITTPMADPSAQMPTPSILIAPIARGNEELPLDGANDTIQLLVFSCLYNKRILLTAVKTSSGQKSAKSELNFGCLGRFDITFEVIYVSHFFQKAQ